MKIRQYNRPERNRRERKQRYIRAKNLMRQYPDCAYGGDFYCNHVYNPQYPWVWVDFRFFHSKFRRYYAVSMLTAEYEVWTRAEDRASEIAYDLFPQRDDEFIKFLESDDDTATWVPSPPTEHEIKRDEFKQKLFDDLIAKPTFVRPSIELKDYGPVAVGMYATVNNQHIDEHVIREFIAFFRSFGEPVKSGWTWQGEETQVDARRLKERSKAT